MAKKETSKKRGESWQFPVFELKPDAAVRSYDPSVRLRDPAFIQKAVLEAISDGDDEAVVTILRAHLRVLNRSRSAIRMRVSRQFVHRLIVGSQKPSLPTLGKFMRLLKDEQLAAQKASH